MTASLNEPFAGWVDNFNGPTGLVSALAKGMFRTMMCEKNYVADMVPVDIVINLMIAAAWRTATRKSNNLLIYNCCTGQRNPIVWSEFVKHAMSSVRKHPLGMIPRKGPRYIIYNYHNIIIFCRGLPVVSDW